MHITVIARQEAPAAAYAHVTWDSEGDEFFLSPLGLLDARRGPLPAGERLLGRLSRYCRLLDHSSSAAWDDLTEGGPRDGDELHLDLAAALALPAGDQPGAAIWQVTRQMAADLAGRPATSAEAATIAKAIEHSTIPDALGDVLVAVCGNSLHGD